MWHPEEGLIHSWLDGAVGEDDARRIEEHLSKCESCPALVAEARGLVAGASRIVGALDNVPADVLPRISGAAAASATTVRPSFWNSPALRIAAGLIFVAGVSTLAVRQKFPATVKGSVPPVSAPVAAGSDAARDSIPSIKATTDIPLPPGVERAGYQRTGPTAATGETRTAGRTVDNKSATALASGKDSTVTPPGSIVRSDVSGNVASNTFAPRIRIPEQAVSPIISKEQIAQLQKVLASSQGTATRLERLSPVLAANLGRADSAIVVAERETAGCYVLTALSVDNDARRVGIANSLVGMVALESGPYADTFSDSAMIQQAQQAQQGRAQTQGGIRSGGSGAGRGGRGGGGGGGAGGGGGGRAGARGAGAAAAPPSTPVLSRALGWRIISADSIELRVAIDTALIAMRLQRSSDSSWTGIARAATDTALGAVANVTALKAQCE